MSSPVCCFECVCITCGLCGSYREAELDPLCVFHQPLENATPILGTLGLRKGGRTYQVRFTGVYTLVPGTSAINRQCIDLMCTLSGH